MTKAAPRVLLLGAGRMGLALLSGWLARRAVAARPIVLEPHPAPALTDLAAQGHIALNPASASSPVDLAVIAVKPQLFSDAVPGLRAYLAPATAVMSIAAGKSLGDLAALLGAERPLIRVMPNTPAAIGAGISVACAAPQVDSSVRAQCTGLLAAVGEVEWVDDERLMDAVTAVSGSGPAYVFYFTECLAEAGRAAGLERGLAERLARATVTGAGALLSARADAPAALRAEVTSPGGTTQAALEILLRGDEFARLLKDAVEAARRRGVELSQG